MAKRCKPDFHADVYLYVCNYVRATGEFPSSTEIAQRLNLNYQTVYNALKVLETHGLIEQTKGKREAGKVRVERRIISRVRPVPVNGKR
jgi:DNA-binding transcriptional regulator YhcF (GntR family)